MDQLATYTAPSVNNEPSTTTWTYDDDGDRDLVTLPGGSIIDYTPDNAGRPHMIVLPNSEGTITFGYHPTTGHLATLDGPMNVNLAFGYNGRLLTDQTWSGMGFTTIVHHDHDNNFRIATETINGLFPAAFGHDRDGLLTLAGTMTLQRNAQTGLLDGSAIAMGIVSDSYQRNAHGEVTQYTVSINGVPLLAASTPRDALGRIDTRTEVIGTQTKSVDYVYDPAGRLQEVKDLATNQVLAHYDYDSNGNRLGRTTPNGTETGTYDAQDRLVSYGGRTYTYTLAGSLASMTEGNATTTYTYDAQGGLRQVVKPNGDVIQYVVDGAGRRVWKKVNDKVVQGFVYADALRPVAELDRFGNIVARFIYGRHVNVPDLMIKNGTTLRPSTGPAGHPAGILESPHWHEQRRVQAPQAPPASGGPDRPPEAGGPPPVPSRTGSGVGGRRRPGGEP